MIHWSGFTPHAVCLLWNWPLITLIILGNLLVFLAYMWIPLELIRGARKAKLSIPPEARATVYDFALFILCCGCGHLIAITLLWFPNYWFEALWTLLGTASFSWRCVLRIRKHVRYYLPLLAEPVNFAKLKAEVQRMHEQLPHDLPGD